MDLELLSIALLRPDWHLVIIDQLPNSGSAAAKTSIISSKDYKELPAYLAVDYKLFARNESTRFISPTKTPEYLAAGKPVVYLNPGCGPSLIQAWY